MVGLAPPFTIEGTRMAAIPLYRRTGTLPNRYARFPEDYEVACYSIVDDEFAEHEWVTSRRWTCLHHKESRTRYARAYERVDGKYVSMLLHRLVWNIKNGPIKEGLWIDHANRNGLDNRICNLRLATTQQNLRNTAVQSNSKSKYRGVDSSHYRKYNHNSHNAYLGIDGRKLSMGFYPTEAEAAVARDIAASILYGGFFAPNDVPLDEVPEPRRLEIRIKVESNIARHGIAIPS